MHTLVNVKPDAELADKMAYLVVNARLPFVNRDIKVWRERGRRSVKEGVFELVRKLLESSLQISFMAARSALAKCLPTR